jgi:lipoprotein-releasing system ATP-binding protein
MLQAKGIHKNYGELQVLKGVDLELQKGEIVSIAGPSGSGKSTLLHILGTLDRPSSGDIFISGQKVNALSDKLVAAFRNKHIGFVFQFHHLLPEFTALENVCIPGWINGRSKKEVNDRAIDLLTSLGLDGRLYNKPGALQGENSSAWP